MTHLFQQTKSALADEYDLKSEIGRGGMATVFLADEVQLRRQVAIKVLDPELTSTVSRERFLREVNLVSKLAHPHIVPIFSAGEADGLLYYVMPFIEGETLRERIRREGRLDALDAVEITREAAGALQYAHDQGLIHRDIKPENILLSGGHAVVADFGIARAMGPSSDESLTLAGRVIGTPGYMSPEQALASRDVDSRTDIYSLGCVLYEMLVGERPPVRLGGSGADVSVEKDTPLKHRNTLDTLPRDVVTATVRAISLSPSDRFRTASDFARALRGSTERTPLGGAWRRNRLAKLTAVVATAVLVVVLAVLGKAKLTGGGQVSDSPRAVVAVLENETGDPQLDYIGRLAADWITRQLAQSGLVEVVGSQTSFASSENVDAAGLENQPDRARAVALEADAGIVISGQYYRQGDSIQFYAQVTDARAGRLMSGVGPISGLASNPLEAVEVLGRRVTGALAPEFDQSMASRASAWSRPPTLQAYQEYVEGMRLFMRLRLDQGIERLRRAASLDSTFSTALLFAAMAHSIKGEWAQTDSITGLLDGSRDRLAPADRLLLDWLMAEVRGDHDDALLDIRKAAKTAPGAETSLLVAMTALRANRPKEALDVLHELHPDRGLVRGFFVYWEFITDAHHRLGEHKKELEAARKGRRQYPAELFTLVYELRPLAALGRTDELRELISEIPRLPAHPLAPPGMIYRQTALELRSHGYDATAREFSDSALRWFERLPPAIGNTEFIRYEYAQTLYLLEHWDQARALFSKLAAEVPDSASYLGYLGSIAAAQGEVDQALRISDRLREFPGPYLYGRNTFWRGAIAARFGERDRAASLFRQAIDEGSYSVYWDLETEPALRGLREYAPFQELSRSRD